MSVLNSLSQIQFVGIVSQGEGIAGWNANGSGPEPAGLGHLVPAPGFINQYYYGSSHDYITENPDHACAHFLPGLTGFPLFEQALADNGYTADQVKMKYGLTSLEDDLEGIDWFFFENYSYSNYYNVSFTFELDGQPLLAGFFDYANMYINTLSGNWQTETGYSPLHNVAVGDIMIEIANAFLSDLDGKEIKTYYEATYGQAFSGNGRTGAYYNVLNGLLTAGNPTLPFQGLNDDHEGFAGWDADGTGPETFGDGHATQLYYGASLDYDDIDPDPNACLGHFLDGSTGFFNTLLQLEYRGYEIGDLKLKLGLNSLGPDVQGEDWGYENGHPWCNYYNNGGVIELDGEPILVMLQDTNKLVSMGTYWLSDMTIGKIYDASENASPEAQFVAQSILRDIGSHYIKTETSNIQYVSLFNGNGRDGGIYEIESGSIVGVHEQATFISEGTVYGIWNLAGSPYYVDGHISIENGYTLTVQPGVKVAARGPYQINVNGDLYAEGTADANILFTHSNPNVWWDGIGFDGEIMDPDAVSVFDHCTFEHTLAQGPDHQNSGGVFVVQDFNNFQIYNSTFRYNLANIDGGYPPSGGAIALWNSSPLIQNCTFYENSAEYGGAIFIYMNSEPVISNCLFYNNEADNGGALAFFEYGNGTLINNTITENTALNGGAMYFYHQSNPEVINNIFWSNTAEEGSQVFFPNMLPSYPGFYYNDIEGGKEGFHLGQWVDYLFNINEDPLFLGEPDSYPFMITAGSPCKDMGTPDSSAWFYPEYLPETCLAGCPRIINERIDIGAFESMVVGYNIVDAPELQVSVYPNPFTERLDIGITLSARERVSLQIFNTTGAMVARMDYGELPAGNYTKTWRDASLPDGIYFCRIQIGSEIITRKVVKAN